MNYLANGVVPHAKTCCNHPLAVAYGRKFTDFLNFSGSKFVWQPLSKSGSTLFYRVFVIFASCSNPKMFRIYTAAVVTFWTVVKNTEATWDGGFVVDNPRCNMGPDAPSKSCREKPVTVLVFRAIPKPARFGFVYLAPKTRLEVAAASVMREVRRWIRFRTWWQFKVEC